MPTQVTADIPMHFFQHTSQDIPVRIHTERNPDLCLYVSSYLEIFLCFFKLKFHIDDRRIHMAVTAAS